MKNIARGPAKDLKKLRAYARSLGIKVTVKRWKPSLKVDWGAEWILDPPPQQIILYPRSYTTTTTLVLNLLHELGHHLDFVHRNKVVSDLEGQAIYNEGIKGRVLTQKERHFVRQSEYLGTGYMEPIWTELGLSVPLWKVRGDVDTDRWVADYFYEHGKYPLGRELDRQRLIFRARRKVELKRASKKAKA